MSTFLKINKLVFKRGNKFIFNKANLEIPSGKIVGIMGPSGCGKTTLLRLIGGQLKAQSGNIALSGKDIGSFNRSELLNFRKNIGFLFQSGALFSDMNVYQNVAFPLKMHTDLPENIIRDIVMLKLECVGLRGAHKLMPNELSGGMSRRIALARSIALDPQLMMYDEPFAGQDPIGMGVIVDLIKTLNDNLGLTSILVSHDISETLSIADYVYVLAAGKVIGKGNPQSLFEDNQSPFVKQFINGEKEGPVAFHYPAIELNKQLRINAN